MRVNGLATTPGSLLCAVLVLRGLRLRPTLPLLPLPPFPSVRHGAELSLLTMPLVWA